MKRLTAILLAFLAVAGISLVSLPHAGSDDHSVDTNPAAGRPLPKTTPEMGEFQAPKTRNVTNPPADAEPAGVALADAEPASEPAADAGNEFIRRVIRTKWIDAEDKAGRGRIRIVEADFKYPMLRLEEKVWTDPETGHQVVQRLRASVADHLMIGLRPDVTEQEAQERLAAAGLPIRAIEEGSYVLAELPDFEDPDAQTLTIEQLRQLEEFIDFAEPDWIVYPTVTTPNDPDFSGRKMWGLDNPGLLAGHTADADIDAPEGWALRASAPGVVVAVTDTGVNYTHQDLAANMWSNGSGHFGFDAYDDDNDPMDVGGHGTHCAGTIGARGNNGIGLTGVAWECQLMALRFLGPNGGSTSDGIRVINYARQNGADIISASWGGGGYSQGLYNAIKACGEANIPFVAAAGNDSLNNDSYPHYPSNYDLPTLVSVASTTSADKLSYFSNFGRSTVDIAAPGSDIWSCYVGSNSAYKHLNGTSMATPHVSGALALAKAHFPGETADELIARLYSSVDRIPPLAGKCATGGRLNLAKLLGASTSKLVNDDFADALVFTGDYGYWSGTNTRATREEDEDSFAIAGSGERSLWFAWTAPYRGLVEFSVDASAAPLRVVGFRGDTKDNLGLVADSGSLIPKPSKTIRFYSTAGQSYRFLVDSSHPTGQQLSVSLGLLPQNDNFISSIVLEGDRFTATGSNRNATQEPFEKNNPHAGVGQGKSVWWKWRSDVAGDMIISTFGSEFDTVLAVYTGNSQYVLTEVASNDDRNPLDWTSQVQFTAAKNTTYHIAVDGFRGDASGQIILNGFPESAIEILKQPESQKVELGGLASFEVTALGSTDLRYQWLLDGVPLPGETRSKLVIASVDAEDFGDYQVEISNSTRTVTSATATLTERRTAPIIYWTSGNQTLLEGGDASLSVQVRGSAPITLQWEKDGVPIPGATTRILSFPSAAGSDSGLYTLIATNSEGSAQESMQLNVVTTPWDGWEWRLDSSPRAAVTDIKVRGSEAFAVAGNELLRSDDGENWTSTRFPDGFQGHLLAIEGTTLTVIGESYLRAKTAAISIDDGATWTLQPITGLPPSSISSMGMLLTVQNTLVATVGSLVYHSADGLSWQTAQSVTLDAGTTSLQIRGRIATDGTTLVAASTRTPQAGQIRYYTSTNGSDWTEFGVIVPDFPTNLPPRALDSAFFQGGEFFLVGNNKFFRSPDAVQWTYQYSSSSSFGSSGIVVGGADGQICLLWLGLNRVSWFREPTDVGFLNLEPSGTGAFTAGADYPGGFLYGTSQGRLQFSESPEEIIIGEVPVSPISRVEFVNDRFLAIHASNSTSTRPQYTSSDGIAWEEVTRSSTSRPNHIGYANGHYWGSTYSYSTSTPTSGPHFGVYYPLGEAADGLPDQVLQVMEAPSGEALAVVKTTSSAKPSLHRLAAGDTTWQPVAMDFNQSTLSLRQADGMWFAAGVNGANPGVWSSPDGLVWTPTNLSMGYGGFDVCSDGSKFYGLVGRLLSSSDVKIYESVDGVTWTDLAATGLPTGSFPSKTGKIRYSDGGFVLLISDTIYLSNDAVAWLRAPMPADVSDLEMGNGQIVALLSNGSLLQSGSGHPGVTAPQITIIEPKPFESRVLGSVVNVRGEIADGEEGAASYRAFVDGVEVASGNSTEFSFEFVASRPDSHQVAIRAEDSHGLWSEKVLQVDTTVLEGINLFAEGRGAQSLPNGTATQFGGVLYLAGARELYRSADGVTWEAVPIPNLKDRIHSLAAGNGSMVLQLGNGSVVTTRDGINWVHFTPNLTDYWLRENLRFEGGRYIAAYQKTGTTAGTVMTSIDGYEWDAGIVSVPGYLSWAITNNQGVVVGLGSYQTGLKVSQNLGQTWKDLNLPGTWTGSNASGVHADGKFVVVNPSTPEILTSTDGLTWTSLPHPGPSSGNSLITYLGGRYFLATTSQWGSGYHYSSADLITWDEMSEDIPHAAITASQQKFVARTAAGLVSSEDGIQWDPVVDQHLLPEASQVMATDDGFLMVGISGELWFSPDGRHWVERMSGGGPTTNLSNTVVDSLAPMGSRILVAGTRSLLRFSDDDGKTWVDTTLDGIPSDKGATSRDSFSNLTTTPSAAMAVSFSGFPTRRYGVRSTDGETWHTVADFTDRNVVDFATNGSEWLAICLDGSVLRSLDDGANWSELNVHPLTSGAGVEYFNGQWVLIGGVDADSKNTYHAVTLDTAGTFTIREPMAFYNSNSPVSIFMGHGRMLVWRRGEPTMVTTDGITWTEADLNAGSGNHDYSIYSDADGFVAVVGSTVSFNPVRMWRAGPDGLDWNQVATEIHNVTTVKMLGARTFLVAPGSMIELYTRDAAIDFGATSPVTLGVGDTLSIDVLVQNLGVGILDLDRYSVDAWFSKNTYFGDADDTYLGTSTLGSGTVAEGAEQSVPVGFQIPEGILAGDNHVIIELRSLDQENESNPSNNLHISDDPLATVPEWALNLNTIGNGAIDRDLSSLRYPHGSRVSLNASAGKGAVFAGWEGDAVDSRSQITILMDGDKSVQANFASRATLQVLVRGAGSVTGTADLGSYAVGSTASVTAVPDTGWIFSGWTGDSSDSTPGTSVVMDENKIVMANFVLPQATWKDGHFSAAQLADESVSGDFADPDGDGLKNWQEYLHLSNPLDSGSKGILSQSLEPDYLTLIYTRNAGNELGLQLFSEGSRNLTDWGLDEIEERILSTENGIETVEARLPREGTTKGFIRLYYEDPSSGATLSLLEWTELQFEAPELADPNVSGPDADPDKDGLKNWQEYLHLSDPKDRASVGIVTRGVDSGFLKLTYSRNLQPEAGYSLGGEGSRDLNDWEAPDFQETEIGREDGSQTMEARLPTGGHPNGYVRLNYRRP